MPLDDYEVVSKVSSGKYSVVYKVRRVSDKKIFALKKVPLLQMESRSKKNALTEVKLLQNFKHPNIISLIQVCYDTEQGHLCLILEYSQKGDLASQIKKRSIKRQFFKEEQLWSFLYQISKGLQCLHEQNILHRDLKPSNILWFADGVAKIADLNVSTPVQNLNYTRTGTLTYASPQIWKGEVYDNKCDIWSLGCLIYQLAALQVPFQADNMQKLYRNIVKCNYNKLRQNYSREFRDLVSFMIQINTKLRPTAKTICKISANHCNLQRDKGKLHLLTPFIQSKYRLKPIQTSLIEQNQVNISMISRKQNTKRMLIKSQKLRNSNSPKFLQESDAACEKELKNTEQIKDYIYNRLIRNNTFDGHPQERKKQQFCNSSNIYKRVFKLPKPEKLQQMTRQRRNTQN